MIPVYPGPTDSPIEQAARDVDGHYDWYTPRTGAYYVGVNLERFLGNFSMDLICRAVMHRGSFA